MGRIGLKYIIRYGFSTNEVFLNDALEHFWRARVIPDTFRVDHRDRAFYAHAQAVRARSKHNSFVCKMKLSETVFEKVPRLVATLPIAAFWLSLVAAQEDVTLYFIEVEGFAGLLELRMWHDANIIHEVK